MPLSRIWLSGPALQSTSNFLQGTKSECPEFGAVLAVAQCTGCDEPEIGNVDEGIVEGGKDTGNAEDELAYNTAILENAHTHKIFEFFDPYHHRPEGRE